MGENMRSEEKIKVFISSKCGGERINFDRLIESASSDKKTVADKAIRTNYDIVRRALQVALENTGFIETYIFEDDAASSSTSREDYLFKLDQSDVCLFLIDNFDKEIPKGILVEVERAKQTNKKSIFLFLKDRNRGETDLQKNLEGPDGRHYHDIYDIREFIDAGYKAVISDIIKTYQKYCRGYLSENDKETSTVDITAESFPVETTDIDKQIFKNLGLTKNRIIKLVYPPDEQNVQTSDLDRLCLSVIEFLLGEKKFKDINLEALLKALSAIQSPKLHELVSRRWEAIASFYNGDIENAISIDEAIYNVFSKDGLIPNWLLNDVLIDWRNLQTINNQIKNVHDFSIQEKINQQNSLIFFPLTDRFSTNINEDIWDRNFKVITGSPYSTTYYSLGHLFEYVSSYLFAAIYYGSYTHIVLTLKEIQKALFDIVQKENNLLHKAHLMKISILRGDESSFDNIFRKYRASLSHVTAKEVFELYGLSDTKPLQYEKVKWKIILYRELGYYFSDADYQIVSNEIFELSRSWMREENVNIFLVEKLLKALKSNVRRLSQEEVVIFTMEILDKKYYRFFDSVFDLLSGLDFSKLSKELARRLLSKINFVLSNAEKKQSYSHVEKLLIGMRKGQDVFGNEIDGIVKKYYPEFYKRDYNLEVFPKNRDTHIQRYINSIKTRNDTQGKGGIYVGFTERPYSTIRNIIEFDKPLLSEVLLDDLLETILNTLRLETQTYAEKIDAIELMMTLKKQELPYSYNWDNYYSKLEQHFSEMEKGHSGFFIKDESLLLRMHLIFVKITFGVDCLQELLEILALINNSDEYEIISSLAALKEFLRLEVNNLIEKPVMPMLVQYISTCCFNESSDSRFHAVGALYLLIESQYADFVINRLSKMMDDDDYRVRWAILNQVSLIKKHNEQTYNYIIGKAKIDNNYLIRQMVESNI